MNIIKYSYNEKKELSPHFSSIEFQCKCGKPHDYYIADDLIKKTAILFEKLDCSMILVNSGYRCAEHDKAVGGSGAGQHTKGTACDVRCYDKKGGIISSKMVCCVAQDIGFTGIANINTKYTDTHLDVRTGSKWYGDETKGNSTVTDDFYKYFGIQREEPVNVPRGTIRKGDKSDSVLWLQSRLYDLGYMQKVDIDGIFGIKTQRALVCFQFENGLTVDGICGDKTKEKLK